MPDDWNTPGLAQDLLPLLTVHVLHIRIVFRKSKDAGNANKNVLSVLSLLNLKKY